MQYYTHSDNASFSHSDAFRVTDCKTVGILCGGDACLLEQSGSFLIRTRGSDKSLVWIHLGASASPSQAESLFLQWKSSLVSDTRRKEIEERMRLEEVEEDACLLKKEMERMSEDYKERYSALKRSLDDKSKLHETYKKTKHKEVTTWREQCLDAKKEADQYKTSVEDMKKEVELLTKSQKDSRSSVSDHVPSSADNLKCYELLVGGVKEAFVTKMEEDAEKERKKAERAERSQKKKKKGQETLLSTNSNHIYYLVDGSYTYRVVDTFAVSCLDQLRSRVETKVNYAIGSNPYEAVLDSSSGDIEQTNVKTGVVRTISFGLPSSVDNDSTYSPSNNNNNDSSSSGDASSSGGAKDLNKSLCFREEPSALVGRDFLDKLKSLYWAGGDVSSFESVTAGEMAEWFGKEAGYTDLSYVSSLGNTKCKMLVKPLKLGQFISRMEKRVQESTNGKVGLRIVFHGCRQSVMDSIEKDPIGFDSHYWGSQGQNYGKGTYGGLSYHASENYCDVTGKGVLCLLLQASTDLHSVTNNLETIQFHNWNVSTKKKNAIVVNSDDILLPFALIDPM